MICLRTLLRIYEKIQPKKIKKLKGFLGCPNCPNNKRVVVLVHNSTTIYPIDMRLVASQTLFVFTCFIKMA
jgi:hypothetical protein